MADIVVSVGNSPVINTMNGDEYQIYKILENIETQLSNKVDKITGKGLSSNDYTAEEKTKLSELPTKTELDTDLSGKEDTANKVTTLDSNSTDTQYPSAKTVYDEVVKKAVGKMVSMLEDQTGEIFNDYVNNKAMMDYSHAEGENNTAYGRSSHAEGSNNEARGADSHCEGSSNKAVGNSSHCEGIGTTTINTGSHAEGQYTKAHGEGSHAEGWETQANGDFSHAEGYMTRAQSNIQHVQGKFNKEDTASKYAHIVGNGTSDSDRSNAHTLDWDGNTWYKGKIKIGGTSYDDGKTVETETTISTSTVTTPSITLSDNTETRYAEIASLTVTLPETISDSFISSVIFKSGATATTVTVPSNVYCQGADCKNSAFLPKANKRYTMIFSYDGIMNCYIAAVPIQTAETQSENVAEDEASVMSDESTAEETESVTEEPESEPNEVI